MRRRKTTTLTFSLLCFSLFVGTAIYTSLENLILALKLVTKLVLEIAHFLVVNVHLFRTVTALEGSAIPL